MVAKPTKASTSKQADQVISKSTIFITKVAKPAVAKSTAAKTKKPVAKDIPEARETRESKRANTAK